MKSQRLRWAGHVIRMDARRTDKKLTEWEPCSSRPVGRPRLRWLDQVEEDCTMAFENKHGVSSIYGTFLNTILTHNIRNFLQIHFKNNRDAL